MIIVQKYPYKRFCRTSADTLTAELSEVSVSQIYDDACDAGVAVIGQHRTIIFNMVKEERNELENELLAYHLEPIEKHKDQPIKHLILFND